MNWTRTHKYLYPSVLLGYDNNFTRFLVELSDPRKPVILNSFLGDVNYGKVVNACIFLLMKKILEFDNILAYLQKHKSYEDDYSLNNDLHMFVLKVPSERAYNWFVLSRYSKMYDSKFVEQHFRRADGSYTESYHVLMKTKQKWLELKESYNFSDNVDPLEYDSCIKMQEEVYNFVITNQLKKD